jgi:hypothetical protein
LLEPGEALAGSLLLGSAQIAGEQALGPGHSFFKTGLHLVMPRGRERRKEAAEERSHGLQNTLAGAIARPQSRE